MNKLGFSENYSPVGLDNKTDAEISAIKSDDIQKMNRIAEKGILEVNKIFDESLFKDSNEANDEKFNFLCRNGLCELYDKYEDAYYNHQNWSNKPFSEILGEINKEVNALFDKKENKLSAKTLENYENPQITKIHIFSLKTGGMAIECYINGEKKEPVKMTKEDVMSFNEKTDRQALATKYFLLNSVISVRELQEKAQQIQNKLNEKLGKQYIVAVYPNVFENKAYQYTAEITFNLYLNNTALLQDSLRYTTQVDTISNVYAELERVGLIFSNLSASDTKTLLKGKETKELSIRNPINGEKITATLSSLKDAMTGNVDVKINEVPSIKLSKGIKI